MKLSENIKRLREKQGLSLDDVAENMGVGTQEVSKWETGKAEPSTHQLLQLAELLTVDANILRKENKEQEFLKKENILKQKFQIVLNRRNAIFLIGSCTAQMFIWCINVNPGQPYKYILSACSFVLICLLLYSIWFKTDRSVRTNVLFRIFLFTLLFNIVLILSSKYMGGFISFGFGIILINYLVKIEE